MKYTAIFGLAALTFGFCACDEIEESTGLPQTNPQLPIVTISNLPVTPDAATDQSVNLTTANDNGGTINVATITTPSDFPEGYTAQVLRIELSDTPDFAKVQTVEAETDADGEVTVQADDWQAAHVALFGKNPKTTTSYVRIPAWAVAGKQQIRLGGENEYYSSFSTEVTPLDLFSGHVIEDAYYLLYSNDQDSWDFSKAIKFEHSDSDPYDDPVFNVNVPAQSSTWYWVIVPESTYATGAFVNGPESSYSVEFASKLSGDLMTNDTDDYGTPGKVTLTSAMSVKVDMEKLTYNLSSLVLYTPGASNGWDFGKCQQLEFYEAGKYRGFVYISGEFKLTSAPSWDGEGNYGGTTDGGDGKLVNGSNDNLKMPATGEGLYFMDVNTSALTYTLTYISSVNIPGGYNGWDVTVKMTSDDYIHWTYEADLQGGEFKFAFNDGWGLSYGGDSDNLVYNSGSNCVAPAGTYLVTLDLSTVPYSYTLTAK